MADRVPRIPWMEWAHFCSFTVCPALWWWSPSSMSSPTETYGWMILSHRANQPQRFGRQCGRLCCAHLWSCWSVSWLPDGRSGLECRPFGRVDLERRLAVVLRWPRKRNRHPFSPSCIHRVRTAQRPTKQLCVRRTQWSRWQWFPNTARNTLQLMCTGKRGATKLHRSRSAWRATKRCCKKDTNTMLLYIKIRLKTNDSSIKWNCPLIGVANHNASPISHSYRVQKICANIYLHSTMGINRFLQIMYK